MKYIDINPYFPPFTEIGIDLQTGHINTWYIAMCQSIQIDFHQLTKEIEFRCTHTHTQALPLP